jgi:serine/threonine protein kinase
VPQSKKLIMKVAKGKTPEFRERYELGKKLGSGAFSVVKLGTDRIDGTTHAVKCISKTSLSADEIKSVKDEVKVLERLKHPTIMRLDGFFEDAKFYYLVTELADGGDLFDKIVAETEYNEEKVPLLARSVMPHAVLGRQNCLRSDPTCPPPSPLPPPPAP